MKVLLIGGPGNISAGAIDPLLKRGAEIAIFTLPETDTRQLEKSVKFYQGNRDQTDALKTAFDDFHPEVVIDFVCFTPAQCAATCQVVRGKVRQYVLVSTVDVYGYPLSRLPMPETGFFRTPVSQYAKDKFACEQLLARCPDITSTIVRPSYSMGHSFVLTPISHLGGRQLIPRLRNGLPVFLPGDGTTLLHASIAQNTGAMIATTAGQEIAFNKAYSCAHEYFITHECYINLFAQALGVEPNIVHIPTDFITRFFPDDFSHTMLDTVTRFNLAFSVERFKTDFPSFRWETSLEDFVAGYIRYCDEKQLWSDPSETILDDRIIAAWKTKMGS